jgi:hypothetical protein
MNAVKGLAVPAVSHTRSHDMLSSACAVIGPDPPRVLDTRALVPPYSRATEAHVTTANRPAPPPVTVAGFAARACAKPPNQYDRTHDLLPIVKALPLPLGRLTLHVPAGQ